MKSLTENPEESETLTATERYFSGTMAVILAAATLSKLPAFFQKAGYLAMPNYVFNGFSNGAIYGLGMFIETGVAGAMALSAMQNTFSIRTYIVAIWMCVVFTGYRLVSYALSAPRPCECLGVIPKLLHLPPWLQDITPWIILASLAIGSLVITTKRLLKWGTNGNSHLTSL